MKLYNITEGNDTSSIRNNIKFIIWQRPEKKIKWLSDNKTYQKIEYKYENYKEMIFIQFLLGYVESDKTWKLWAGKIGGVDYDDDPYCKLDTEKFSEAVVNACDKIEEIINKIKDDPLNYIQYYKTSPNTSSDDEEEGGDDEGGGDLL